MGEHEFNKRSKTKELKPVGEVVTVPVPPIVDRETFDTVQALLPTLVANGGVKLVPTR